MTVVSAQTLARVGVSLRDDTVSTGVLWQESLGLDSKLYSLGSPFCYSGNWTRVLLELMKLEDDQV